MKRLWQKETGLKIFLASRVWIPAEQLSHHVAAANICNYPESITCGGAIALLSSSWGSCHATQDGMNLQLCAAALGAWCTATSETFANTVCTKLRGKINPADSAFTAVFASKRERRYTLYMISSIFACLFFPYLPLCLQSSCLSWRIKME